MNGHPHGEQISAYVDGMLDVAQMHSVAGHLAVCPQCRAAQESLSQTKHLLASMCAPTQPDPQFWAGAYRRMRVESAERLPLFSGVSWERLRSAFHDPQRRWSAGLAAAAVVAGMIAAPLLNNQSPVRTSPASVSAGVPDSVDVSTLMQAHTESAARQPLADTDRQDVIALDNSFPADDPNALPADLTDADSDASP